MVISPKFRGFICTTAHPAGCARNVEAQIAHAMANPLSDGPKKVLVIGASTGYGLASRIAATYSAGASTVGVFFERPAAGNRTATAGWYNTAAFETRAHQDGFYAKSINGDAFSTEIKDKTIDLIKQDLGQVDLVVYSLASPRRTHPVTGETYNSVLKPIGKPYTNKTVDFHSGAVSEITIEPANDEEIRQTVAVMGGEDWAMWMDALAAAGVLSDGFRTVAYSYIGPEVTHAIYRAGTIGGAKNHLEATAQALTEKYASVSGKAYVSVNKALVTQASSAIPIVPLYISILFKVMKSKGNHEGCIEQIVRLYNDRLYAENTSVDEKGRIRVDDWEMEEDIQAEVDKRWDNISTEAMEERADMQGFRKDFFGLFGFDVDGVDYSADVETEIAIPGLVE